MATGDDAIAAGMDVVPGTADRRSGYLEINKTRDYVAQERTARTTALNNKYDKPGDGAGLARREPGSAHEIGFYTVQDSSLYFRPDPTTAVFDRQVTTSKELLPVAQGKLTSDVYNRQIGGNRRAVVVQDDGQLGYAASSERYKKFVHREDVTDEQIMMLTLVSYQWKAAVAVDDRREMGLIAERLVEAGLGWACFYGENGVEGINYDMIGVALLPAVQRLIARVARLEDDLELAHDGLDARLRALEESN
ncbi:hypothetical protein QE392_001398 [Microbacterium proteolyticum]|uniref:tail fiber domain-containing protein n=1 Tax=Microbacterium proteolyticum TaxID=1572644 RepID=UPI002788CC43|nr:tail fiber domain-containing protein [Microbacterium proteolyticum]MDQ1169594.1 hypothetical protein [Microbacterium proteolyticum]